MMMQDDYDMEQIDFFTRPINPPIVRAPTSDLDLEADVMRATSGDLRDLKFEQNMRRIPRRMRASSRSTCSPSNTKIGPDHD